jgi:hypothetical protein
LSAGSDNHHNDPLMTAAVTQAARAAGPGDGCAQTGDARCDDDARPVLAAPVVPPTTSATNPVTVTKPATEIRETRITLSLPRSRPL